MEKFENLINSTTVPVLVDFYATWCGPCKMMHPILENVKSRVGDKARIVKIDVDEQQALAMQYRIQAVPTLMLFKNGQQVWRQSGVVQSNELVSLIEQYV
ncbi:MULTISPECIES: thioredoxin [Bacteroides]|jgi:thioredoxin 1|uniref:thioredoxin n=1 Tax=Bacteroides TaxID=816 RepID=UPI00033DF972|nr:MULTISPECIES: thioredoxin [Bacteroides]MDO3391645.1 thioredoxin [Bacteroides sp. ET489]CDB11552.1 thioredoxin [Bacteroides sp. CAG:633]